MTDEFGPWEPATVEEIVSVFTGAPFRWWLTGGIALELFTGRSWRRHEDIDVGICRVDAPIVHGWLQNLDTYVAAGGRLRKWDGERLSEQRAESNVWVRRPAGGPFLFDIPVGGGDNDGWSYRRDPRIRRPCSDVIVRTPTGIPYLAPEIQLLFKSTGLRAKDTVDAEMVLPLMCNNRQIWLRQHLPEGHSWHDLLYAGL